MKIVLLGAPGSGKGTQAKLLSEEFNIPHISTGEILRTEIQLNSELGRQIDKIISKGNFMPDELMLEIIKKRIFMPDCEHGFILDGYPRSVDQAKTLSEITDIDYVIYLNINHQKVIDRLSNRWTCVNCQKSVIDANSKKCAFCGGELSKRTDDSTEVIKVRLNTYEKQTKPLISYYESSGKITEIDADQEIDKVFSDIKMAIN